MATRLYQYCFPSPRWGFREGLILQWDDGWGEIAPLPGFSKETLAEARAEILSLLPELAYAQPKLPSVRFGLACASLPFSRSPLRVPLCALNTPRPFCSTLKLKLGALSIEPAIAHVKQHIGKYRLRLDCNRSWNLDQALAFARHFSPDDFEYLEEPLQTFPDLVRFSQITQFPIAVDESLRDSPYLEIPTLKAAVVKPTLMGSLPSLSVPLVLSSSYESSLGILQIARLATSNIPQGLDTFADDFLIPPLRAENGFLTWTPTSNPFDLGKLCLIAAVP